MTAGHGDFLDAWTDLGDSPFGRGSTRTAHRATSDGVLVAPTSSPSADGLLLGDTAYH
jgi:hypothetical protein